jgi:hypothetical protein
LKKFTRSIRNFKKIGPLVDFKRDTSRSLSLARFLRIFQEGKRKMTLRAIQKDLQSSKTTPNLVDYAAARAEFSWAEAEQDLSKLPGERGLNIAYECVDRHAKGARRDDLALRWLGKQGEVRDFSYGDLSKLSTASPMRSAALASAKATACSLLPGESRSSTSRPWEL